LCVRHLFYIICAKDKQDYFKREIATLECVRGKAR